MKITKRQMRLEAKRLLKEQKSRVYPETAARPSKRRRALIAALSVALVAALTIPIAIVMLTKPSPEAPISGQTEENASASAEKPTEKTEQSEPAVVIPTVPNTPTDPTAPTDPTVPNTPTDPTAPNTPTDPTAPNTPTVPNTPTDPTVPNTPVDEKPALPRVPEESKLYFSVAPEYEKKNNVRAAYTPDEDGQAALRWLLEDDGKTYTKLDRLISRYDSHLDENGEWQPDTTPFTVIGGNFYYHCEIDAAELGMTGSEFGPRAVTKIGNNGKDLPEAGRYFFEIWYREAGGDADYQGIRTGADSRVGVYVYPVEAVSEWQPVVLRLPTYNEGIRDLHTNNGQPVDYEFVIVIRDREAQSGNDVVGWGELTVTIDAQYEEHLKEAFDMGLLELPQNDQTAKYFKMFDGALKTDGAYAEQASADFAKAFDNDEEGLIAAISSYTYDKEKLFKLCFMLVYGKSYGDLGAFEEQIRASKTAARNQSSLTVFDEILNALQYYREHN